MKLARYWLPTLLGFALGSLLSFKLSGTPMRDLLASSTAKAAEASIAAEGKTIAPNSPLEDDERFARFFSAIQEPHALKRRSILHSALGDLGTGDMALLLQRIESIRGKLDTSGLEEAVLQQWFEIDRVGARAWIRAHQEYGYFQTIWAKNDPEAALKEIGQNPHLRWAEEILLAAAGKLARGDLAEKARLILQLPESSARNGALVKITKELASGNPSEALKCAQKIPDQALRAATMTNVLADWTRKDSEAAAKEVAARVSEIQNTLQFDYLMSSVVADLAKKDANRAFEWIASLPENQRSESLYSTAASKWAAKQPIEALQWCVANGIDSVSGFRWNGSVVDLAMHSKPMETLQWIQSQPAGEMRDALLEKALGRHLIYRDEPTDSQRETTLQALLSLPGESQIRAASGIAKLIMSNDDEGSQLSRWLENIREPALRSATIAGAAEEAARRDEVDAKNQFFAKYSQGPDRDSALRGLAAGYWKGDSERSAADTALRISDQALRLRTLDTFMVEWLQRDKAAATSWLQNAQSIPPNQKAAWQTEADSAF